MRRGRNPSCRRQRREKDYRIDYRNVQVCDNGRTGRLAEAVRFNTKKRSIETFGDNAITSFEGKL
ncbi:MAG: hypothetical protein ACLFMZ_10500 [Spirochaetaceae bacterium]